MQHDDNVKRYFHLLGSYLIMANRINCCMDEDKEFYQDVCLLLATKMKNARKTLDLPA